jgi:Fe-S-cluster-containing dehydrogenase component
MNNRHIQFDPRRCIACKACEVHCQEAHQTADDVKMGLLITAEPICEEGTDSSSVQILSAFRACFHCEEPWCMAVCPTDAIKKRKEDGIVYVEARLCVGCKACIDACPWRVPQWDESSGKVRKCDYCRERIEAGEKPACVTACTAHALSFGKPNTGTRKTRQDYAKSLLEKKRWL